MKTYEFIEESWYASNGCSCCSHVLMECYNILGDDLKFELMDIDCYVMISPMYSSDGVFGVRLLNEFVELSLDNLEELREELELLEKPKYLNLGNTPAKFYIFTQYS